MVTEDGYILTIHRIPPKKASGVKRPPPVFLGHCLVGSSAIWVFGPPDNSLAYMLSDAGKIKITGLLKSKSFLWV